LRISEIQINNTPYNSTSLAHGQEVLDVQIKGKTQEPVKCDLKLVIKKLDGTPMACFREGRYKGILYDIKPGIFTINRHIRLPNYLADGDYTIDISLYEPNCQGFLKAPNCQTIHIEGFYDQYAHPIKLSIDGFIGLESV
jgi:lipopolysaccharide transport system ATP-binding protein